MKRANPNLTQGKEQNEEIEIIFMKSAVQWIA